MKTFLPLITLLLNAEILFAHLPVATILYFNDAHQIYPVNDRLGTRGGVARLKTIVEQVKKENPHTIVIFGGDLAGGTLFGAVYHGFPQIEAFNRIPIDIANPGQHDFDFGVTETLKLISKSKFQWLTSNLKDSSNNPFAQLPLFVIKKVAVFNIGFIGLTDAMHTTTPSGKIIQADLLQSAKATVDSLLAHNVKIIIAITQTEREINERLLKEIPELDAILTEEQYENRTNIYYVHNRPIIAPCGNMGSVVRLDITRGPMISVRVYALDSTVTEHPALKPLQQKYQQQLEARLAKPIAVLTAPLDNNDTRWQETAIGNLVADAYRDYFQADVGLVNSGGLRASVAAGDFTLKDALSILPFGNSICKIEMTGEKLWQTIAYGVSAVQKKSGRFLQVSGVHYKYDFSQQKLISVRINGAPLKFDRPYTVALPDYILAGGDGFPTFQTARLIVPPASAPQDIAVLIKYCRKLKTITPKVDGRITVMK